MSDRPFFPDKKAIVGGMTIEEIENFMRRRVDYLEGRLCGSYFLYDTSEDMHLICQAAILMNSRLQEIRKDLKDLKQDLGNTLLYLDDKLDFLI